MEPIDILNIECDKKQKICSKCLSSVAGQQITGAQILDGFLMKSKYGP